eukprot:jgi/Psemu1/23852/gm1.23852_g
MGGVHFVPLPTGAVHPVMWRHAFPTWISAQLVSLDNPEGSITNSDLELAECRDSMISNPIFSLSGTVADNDDDNDDDDDDNNDCIFELRRYHLKLGYDTVPKFLDLYGAGLPSKLRAPGTDPRTGSRLLRLFDDADASADAGGALVEEFDRSRCGSMVPGCGWFHPDAGGVVLNSFRDQKYQSYQRVDFLYA